MQITVSHCQVSGRLRISLPGLYRSPSATHRVKQLLATLEPVQKVEASELTGRVLILFNPKLSYRELLPLLELALQDFIAEILSDRLGLRADSLKKTASAKGERSSRGKRRKTSQQILPWHAKSQQSILAELAVEPTHGLSIQEAARRMAQYGPNSLVAVYARSRIDMVLGQFNSLPVAMLGVSAVIATATGGIVDAGVILGVVLINALIGYFTEANAERTIADLGSLGPSYTELLREGGLLRLRVEEVVPGDILRLTPGSQVAADARLLQAHRLTLDESALTGESMPVQKSATSLLPVDTMLGDRGNMIYRGTLVTGGDAVAVVVNTADVTELGRIQSLVNITRPPATPMEQQLDRLGTQLGILSALTCAGIFILGLMRGQPWLQMLTSAISLAVAAVPEGLPAVATSTLALGIHDMHKRKVAVRKLDAVESLGSLQVLCLDKTGTLTTNHMTVVEVQLNDLTIEVRKGGVFDGDGEILSLRMNALLRMLEVVSLCNEVELNGQGEEVALCGSPTEVALVELARSNGIDVGELQRRHTRLLKKERAEGRPWMTTVHRLDNKRRLIAVKGSPAQLLERSNARLSGEREIPLDDDARQRILDTNEQMAAKALRVLGVAYRITDRPGDDSTDNLVWIGLIGMQDPLRPGMAELMNRYHRAGIKTVMITGDQSATAYAIARQLGLNENGAIEILDSAHLDKVDPELLAVLVKRVDVFSRVSPAHKLRIVQALQKAGYVVAMTGDGINDGPALKSADIGIAMGTSGSDVALSVSDMVIEDDNLHTMAEAVRLGRSIYANIRKSVHYLLSTNFSEIEVMVTGVSIGLGQVLNPMQLLWINLVTDIFPALALSLEPPEDDVMRQTPRPADEAIITKEKLKKMALESAFITAGALGAYLFGRTRGGDALANTMVFQSLTLAQLMHAIACRSTRYSLYHPSPQQVRNPWLELALAGTALLQLSTLLLPGMRRLLGTVPLSFLDAGVVVTGASVPLLINEGVKTLRLAKPTDSEKQS
ncbi:MAG: cation-transporting P-type ATPase [Chromatiales bacterium]